MKTTPIEQQRKYYIVTLSGKHYGQTIMCAPSKVKRMMNAMGVKFMCRLRKNVEVVA